MEEMKENDGGQFKAMGIMNNGVRSADSKMGNLSSKIKVDVLDQND